MKLELTNENYCGTVVKIDKLVKLDNCDNIQAAIIMGNQVIVGKDTKIDDIGVFFSIECKLSHNFLIKNNLYRNELMNVDSTKKGMFEDNGRIRCQKFRGNNSEGFFAPLSFFDQDLSSEIGKSFNYIDNAEIVVKYEKINKVTIISNGQKNNKKAKTRIKICDKQFEFHVDTPLLFRNMHQLELDDVIHISKKLHGTSGISSNVLIHKKKSWKEKFVSFIENILDIKHPYIEYKNIYSSRSVIKNDIIDPGFYKHDIWGHANDLLKSYLQDGMSLYYEVVGFIPESGSQIQKWYDYGCNEKEFKVFIYRITNTDSRGRKIEYSPKNVEGWCKSQGLNCVPVLYHGNVQDLYNRLAKKYFNTIDTPYNIFKDDSWRSSFLELLKLEYLEKDCDICNNKVPAEGVVIRKEGLGLHVFKLKSVRFMERESKELDSSDVDIESKN